MRRVARPFALLLPLCALLVLGGIESAHAQQRDYRIGPKDLIAIKVFEEERLNVEVRVSDAGTIRLPLVGDVPIAGLTVNEAQGRLKTILEENLLQNASVTIEIREFRSSPISVIGAVNNPGSLPFSGQWTLIEAITAAGGLATSHGNSVYVLRRSDNGLSDQLTIDLDALMVRAEPRLNIPIFANDLINIPASVDVTIYCLGEVAQPGAKIFKDTERITVLSAIARAGGLTDRAASKIVVRRQTASGEQELTVNYKRIVSGREKDMELKEGDIVLVKESFF